MLGIIKYLYSAFFIIRFCSCNIIANNTFRITNKPACQIKDPFCNTCGQNNVCAACKSGFSLSGGKCCPSGTTNCGGCCQNTLFSNNSCGKTCPIISNGFDQCLFGGCTTLCKKGFNKCGNQCVTLATDVTNCGSCSKKCSAPVNVRLPAYLVNVALCVTRVTVIVLANALIIKLILPIVETYAHLLQQVQQHNQYAAVENVDFNVPQTKPCVVLVVWM